MEKEMTEYERGQRDMLNALLELNPEVAKRHYKISNQTMEGFENYAGQLPFAHVLWTTLVAEQMGIEGDEDTGKY